uniref:Uncharacterized protein n=1 Tax=Candidatus Kentrum sp. DK TaxID=2126562 RepID=A0A450S251_9GAMM|nr:MAG: hypothetical protein BECKDK2373B_GA0170837_10118 [Candidatus Kentron sp. DK]
MTDTRKMGTRVAGDECGKRPGAAIYPLGGSLHSSPATRYVLLTFGFRLIRAGSIQLSSSGVLAHLT